MLIWNDEFVIFERIFKSNFQILSCGLKIFHLGVLSKIKNSLLKIPKEVCRRNFFVSFPEGISA